MAKAPAAQAEPAAAAPAPAPPRSKKLLLIIVAAIVVVLVLVAGIVGVLLLKKGNAATDEHVEEHAVPAVDLSKPPTFVTLEPFVVNLSPKEGDRYLQVVLALRVADPKTGESLKGFMPAIRHEINLLLAGKLPSELSTPDGQADLADEIVERTNKVLGAPPPKAGDKKAAPAPIEAVMFNSFIIQ